MTGPQERLEAARERAHEALMAKWAEEAEEPEPEPRFVFWLEFESTEEDAMAIRDFSRLLDSFEGRYYKRKGRI